LPQSTNTVHLFPKMLSELTIRSRLEVLLKIHILSDLHVEFGNFVPPEPLGSDHDAGVGPRELFEITNKRLKKPV
jgi:hypothetical protein